MAVAEKKQGDPANLEDWRGLIKHGAFRVMRRLHSVGCTSVQLTDITQELTFAWVKARDLYNPELGVPFAAYLSRGMMMHINRWVQSEIDNGHYGHVSLENNDEGESQALSDRLEDDTIRPADETLATKQRRDLVYSQLSERAQQFLRFLESPPEELRAIAAANRTRAQIAREKGLGSFAPTGVTMSLIYDFMDADSAERRSITREIEGLAKKMDRRVG